MVSKSCFVSPLLFSCLVNVGFFFPLPLSTKTQCLKCHFSSGVQEKMGIMNRGVVYALWDYSAENPDELSFHEGDCMTIVRREDEDEIEWWWARMGDTEGYIPRNLLGVSYESAYYQSSILAVKMWIINMFFCVVLYSSTPE